MLHSIDISTPVERAILSTPREVGEYSVNANGTVTTTSAAAKYFRSEILGKPTVHFDLNRGFEQNRSKTRAEVLMDMLTWSVLSSSPNSTPKQAFHDADFVSTRGTLARITTSLVNRSPWRFVARLIDDVIYLCEYKADDHSRPSYMSTAQTTSSGPALPTFYGLKFEQYMTLDDRGKTDTNTSVYGRGEYRVLMKSTLEYGRGKTHKLLYAVEVDAVDKKGGIVELKTAVEGRSFPPYKMQWCASQASFAGLDSIVVGWRSYEGIVHRVSRVYFANESSYNIEEHLSKGYRVLALVLDEVKRHLTSRKLKGESSPSVHVRLSHDERRVYFESPKLEETYFIPMQFCNHFNVL